jgi:hypothetical protein
MEAVEVVGEAGADGVVAAGFGDGAEVEEEHLEADRDREDNHCLEEGRAKSAWRETRIFGVTGLFVVHCFIQSQLVTGYK